MENLNWMVYVSCMTFNHAPYIKDALNGFCMQQTTFPFVCAVIDDASTDGEPKVLRQYLAEHFDLEDETVMRRDETEDYERVFAQHKENKDCFFVVVFLKYNHYSIKKSKFSYVSEWRENAKYIAVCEGDDNWTDPMKLKKQVEFLETYEEYGLVHSKAKIYNQEKRQYTGECGKNWVDFDDIIIRNPVVTLTSCFRSSYYLDYLQAKQKWNANGWLMGDYPLWIWISYHSSIYFMDETMGVYREVKGSATHQSLESRLKFLNNTKEIQLTLAEYFKLSNDYKEKIEYNLNRSSAIACINYGQIRQATYFAKSLSTKDKIICIIIILKRVFHTN